MEKKQKDNKDVNFGSDEMVFWRNLIDAKKIDIKTTEDNLKFYKFIVENAEREYKKAEKKFKK